MTSVRVTPCGEGVHVTISCPGVSFLDVILPPQAARSLRVQLDSTLRAQERAVGRVEH